MKYNSNTIKKLYHGENLVNMAVSTGETGMPAHLSSWTYDDYGRMTSIVVKDGDIPAYWQNNSKALSSVTIPNTVTSIGANAFGNIGSNNNFFDISNIDLSGINKNYSSFYSIFQYSALKGEITIPNSIMSHCTSGYTNCGYGLFYLVATSTAETLTINVYADNAVIPRNFVYGGSYGLGIESGSTVNIYGTPTFLSGQAFGYFGAGSSVYFHNCTTPPNAQAYDTSYNAPFYNFSGTIYVPSAGLTAWKNKYTSVADKIQAVPT